MFDGKMGGVPGKSGGLGSGGLVHRQTPVKYLMKKMVGVPWKTCA